MLSDVAFLIGDGALGLQAPSSDGVSGFLTTGVAVSGGLQLNTPYLLTSTASLEALGVNEQYDLDNKTMIWHHVDEYFRPFREREIQGELYIIVLDQASVALPALLGNQDTSPAILLQNFAQGRIRSFGAAHIPPTTGGTPETVATAVFTVTVDGDEADLIICKVADLVIGTYQVGVSDTETQKANGLALSINNQTSITGYSAEGDGVDLIVTAPPNFGASANSFVAKLFIGGSEINSANFSGGVTEIQGNQPTPNLAQGIDATVIQAVSVAQVLANTMLARKTPVTILIEGRKLAPMVNLGSLADLKALNSKSVAVIVAQDRLIANKKAAYLGYAAVGLALGIKAAGAVNAAISWVERNNLESAAESRMISPSLSNGVSIANASLADLQVINNKGYIFARTYPQVNGCYFSDSATCTVATSDFSNIENNDVINKVIRIAYVTLVPKLNAPQQVNATSGRLLPDVIAYYESLLFKATDFMATREEVSGLSFSIDPTQNFLSTNVLNIKARIVPTGKNKDIVVDIALSNPANS
jgi:hypothetical protein